MWRLPQTDKLTLIRLADHKQEAFPICHRFQSAFTLLGVWQKQEAQGREEEESTGSDSKYQLWLTKLAWMLRKQQFDHNVTFFLY